MEDPPGGDTAVPAAGGAFTVPLREVSLQLPRIAAPNGARVASTRTVRNVRAGNVRMDVIKRSAASLMHRPCLWLNGTHYNSKNPWKPFWKTFPVVNSSAEQGMPGSI